MFKVVEIDYCAICKVMSELIRNGRVTERIRVALNAYLKNN